MSMYHTEYNADYSDYGSVAASVVDQEKWIESGRRSSNV